MRERKTIIRPGYDCRVKCTHDPPGDHGICGDEWVFVVMDGPRAVSLNVLSADYPPTVERATLPGVLRKPMPSGLTVHHADPHGRECDWVTGGKCVCEVSWLWATAFWREYAVGQQSEQPESFWLALESELDAGGERPLAATDDPGHVNE